MPLQSFSDFVFRQDFGKGVLMKFEQRLQAAYAECHRISRRHYENFPTASRLVPRDKRDALAAIYAFARTADDFADEPGAEQPPTPEERLRALAGWRTQLNECFSKPLDEISHPVFLALGDAVRRYQLSLTNLDNLLRAFEQDVRQNRHPELFALSDHICTALQLANFWQDVAIDLSRDRVYLPLDDLARFGLTMEEIQEFLTSKKAVAEERWQRLMAFEVVRTAEIFEQGRALPERVGRQLRRQLRLTWLGGMCILEKIRAVHYDVFWRRPMLSTSDFLRLYFKSWRRLGNHAAGDY